MTNKTLHLKNKQESATRNKYVVPDGKLGRHPLPELDKKDPNTGLTGHQLKWIKEQADEFAIPTTKIVRDSIAQVERLIPDATSQGLPVTMLLERVIDWYFIGVQSAKSDLVKKMEESKNV